MYREFTCILIFSLLCCTQSIAANLDNVEEEDLEMYEDIYASSNQIKIYDPYEKFNRSIYRFNKVVDKFIILPPVKFYNVTVPPFMRRRVSSFFSNLKEPLNTLYGIVQLKPKVAFDSFFRFFMNTTFGILGIFDVAEEANLKKQDISFGDVLKYYGAKEGPYLMLPLLGPTTVRGGIGTIMDTVAHPINIIRLKNKQKVRIYYYIGELIVIREQMLENEKTLSEISLDEYATLRNFYYQKLSILSKEKN